MKIKYKNNAAKERLIKEIKKKSQVLNAICAIFLATAFFMYFCTFFQISIDGAIENKVNGFQMAFLLFGNRLKDKSDILYVVNKSYSGTVKFASIASLLCIISLFIMTAVIIYRAVKMKPVFSKFVILLSSLAFILLIVQIVACSVLSSTVTQNFYAGCATCIAQSYAFLTLIFFIAYIIIYLVASYRLYIVYGTGFEK